MLKKSISGKTIQILLIYCIGFAIGCIYMNFLWKTQGYYGRNAQLFCLDDYFQRNMASGELFPKMVTAAGIMFLLLFAAGFSRIGKAFAQGICLCAGVLRGSLFTVTILGKGAKKVFILLGIQFPQILIYAPVFVLCLFFVCNMSTRCILSEKISLTFYRKYTLYMILLFLILVFGIFLQCYVNPIFAKFLNKF